jgi:putative endonuclease
MDCYVYVIGTLTSSRYLTYVGWTDDVARRLTQHNAGKGARSTRGRAWVLLYLERCASKRHAMSREWHLKRDRNFRKELARKIKTALGHYQGQCQPDSTLQCLPCPTMTSTTSWQMRSSAAEPGAPD